MGREKRKSLTEIASESKQIKEVSEEVSEKIEKFKSKLDKSLKEEIYISKVDDRDPLELIRERKKKKSKEYKDFIDKFKDSE